MSSNFVEFVKVVRLNSKLSAMARLLFLEIANRINISQIKGERRGVIYTEKQIASDFGISVRTANRNLKLLIDSGYIFKVDKIVYISENRFIGSKDKPVKG